MPAVFQSHRRQLRGGIYPRQLRRQMGRGDLGWVTLLPKCKMGPDSSACSLCFASSLRWPFPPTSSLFTSYISPHYGLATLTPARPDCNGTGAVPAIFFSVLQSIFLAHACSIPACLHQNFEGNLKERLFGLKKD